MAGNHKSQGNKGPAGQNGPKGGKAHGAYGSNTKKADGGKIVFTRENINSHLLNYSKSPADYKIMGMLTYLFKEFKNEPTQLLAKLKVLTSNRKEKIEGSSVPDLILNNTFLILELKEDFYTNLFKLLKTDTYLAILIGNLYFSSQIEEEGKLEMHYNQIVERLLEIWAARGSLVYAQYKQQIQNIAEPGKLEEVRNSIVEKIKQVHAEACAAECDEEHIHDGSCCDAGSREDHEYSAEEHVHDEACGCAHEDVDSSISLISLNDDKEIERLDRELVALFGNNNVNEEAIKYSCLLLDCLERMISSNFVRSIDLISGLFYFYQFEELVASCKKVIKVFIEKFGDKKTLFLMFELSALQIPQLYSLIGMFKAHCAEYFDEIDFINVAVDCGHGELIFRRIDSAVYYSAYTESLGELHTDFLYALITNEQSIDALKSLDEKISSDDAKVFIEEKIKKLERRLAHPRKNKSKTLKDKKVKAEEAAECPEPEVCGDRTAHEESAEIIREKEAADDASQPTKKSFKDKIGSRIVDKKADLKKQHRWANYKEKKKNERKAKLDTAEKTAPITKRSLREEAALASKDGNKKPKANKAAHKRN